jgi:photosystem II stability/assembly factor-like uncharacterized protein
MVRRLRPVRLQETLLILIAASVFVVPGSSAAISEWQHVGFDSTYSVPDVVFRPADSETAYAAVQMENDPGIYRSTDNGRSWNLAYPLFSPQALDIDPLSIDTLFCISQSKAYKSIDGGNTWDQKSLGISLHQGDQYLRDISINRCSPETAYVSVGDFGAATFTYFTANGGARWDTANFYGGLLIEMDPFRCGRMYTADETFVQSFLMRTANSGATWDTVLTVSVEGVSIDPQSPDIIYVASSDLYAPGIYRSQDGGDTWIRFAEESGLDDPRMRAVAVNPLSPSVVYAGGHGVYRSADGGTTWTMFNTGLPGTTTVISIAVETEYGEAILLGTKNHGIYRRDESLAGIRSKTVTGSLPLTIAPNPFTKETTISYDIARPSCISVSIYNVCGRRITTLVDANDAAGFHRISWDGKDLHGKIVGPGVYFVRIQGGSTSAVESIVVLRK